MFSDIARNIRLASKTLCANYEASEKTVLLSRLSILHARKRGLVLLTIQKLVENLHAVAQLRWIDELIRLMSLVDGTGAADD